MRLFIRLKNGQPFEHPIFEHNFVEAFPDIDLNALPENFAEFIRVPVKELDTFEVHVETKYEWSGSFVTDVHYYRPMTEEEKAVKIEELKNMPHPANWVWNETLFTWQPPPKPDMPSTGGPWRFDLETYKWVIASGPPHKGWVLHSTGKHYVPPFNPPQSLGPNTRFRWNDDMENWEVIGG